MPKHAVSAQCASVFVLAFAAVTANADEGGVSFWLPGQFGSLAAVPGAPGLSLPAVYYHSSPGSSASKSFPLGGKVVAGLEASADLLFILPTYTSPQRVGGAQMSLSVGWAYGQMDVDIDATLTGPRGATLSRSESDSTSGGSDAYPLLSFKWNDGVHNVLAYTMLGVPVGAYQKGRLANIGTNHWSVDVGGGYTYFNPKNGRELSVVTGLTYNLENSATDYQNGIDSHMDVALSQFLSERLHVGLVGYAYYQLTGDDGDGATLGDFKSRVFGGGPEVGIFVGEKKVYVNVKSYYEFEAKNRPEGWNAWLAVALPLGKG